MVSCELSEAVPRSGRFLRNGRNHINGIESFWAYTKHRLTKFKGIRKDFFYLYLKESEFWYYTKINKENLYKVLLKLVRKNQICFT